MPGNDPGIFILQRRIQRFLLAKLRDFYEAFLASHTFAV